MQIINIDEKLFVLFICKQRQYLTSLMRLLPLTQSADSSEKNGNIFDGKVTRIRMSVRLPVTQSSNY